MDFCLVFGWLRSAWTLVLNWSLGCSPATFIVSQVSRLSPAKRSAKVQTKWEFEFTHIMHTYLTICIYLLYIYTLYIYLFHIYIFCIHVITANDTPQPQAAKRVSTTSTHIHTRHSSECHVKRASNRSIDQWRDPTHFLAAVPETRFPLRQRWLL